MYPHSPHSINRIAGGLAGIIAGIIATVVQLVLWWISSYAPVEMLLRDGRLAAAIAMGPEILSPPSSFDWKIMLAASLVHVMLSIAYGLALTPLIGRLSARPALLAGVVAGLLLYAVNMYGFTLLFPWFEASRDWITAAAHVSFGASTSITYRYLERKTQRRSGET